MTRRLIDLHRRRPRYGRRYAEGAGADHRFPHDYQIVTLLSSADPLHQDQLDQRGAAQAGRGAGTRGDRVAAPRYCAFSVNFFQSSFETSVDWNTLIREQPSIERSVDFTDADRAFGIQGLRVMRRILLSAIG